MNELNEWIRFLIQYQIVGCFIIGYWRFSRGKYCSYSSDECSTSINCSYRRSNYCEKFNYYLCWECLWDSRHRNVSRWTNFPAIWASVHQIMTFSEQRTKENFEKMCLFPAKICSQELFQICFCKKTPVSCFRRQHSCCTTGLSLLHLRSRWNELLCFASFLFGSSNFDSDVNSTLLSINIFRPALFWTPGWQPLKRARTQITK